MVPAALHGEWPKVAQPPTIIAEITAGAQTNNPKAGNDLSDWKNVARTGESVL